MDFQVVNAVVGVRFDPARPSREEVLDILQREFGLIESLLEGHRPGEFIVRYASPEKRQLSLEEGSRASRLGVMFFEPVKLVDNPSHPAYTFAGAVPIAKTDLPHFAGFQAPAPETSKPAAQMTKPKSPQKTPSISNLALMR